MVGYAVTQGRVFMKSDGSPWRPLIHIEDIAAAFLAVMEAPREAIHNQVLNVGSTDENYQIRDVALIIESTVPGADFEMADTAGPDIRNYRVNCDKICESLPAFRPRWTVEAGARELLDAFVEVGLTEVEFLGPLSRIKHIMTLQDSGRLGADLRLVTSTRG
jgi:nucleoside-diphosphate-sugar epimerase